MITDNQRNNAINNLNKLKLLIETSSTMQYNNTFFSKAAEVVTTTSTADSSASSSTATAASNMTSWFISAKSKMKSDMRSTLNLIQSYLSNNM